MILELAGLPGSGKTTVARRLAQEVPELRRLAPLAEHHLAPRHLSALLVEALRPAGIGPGTGWPAWARLWTRWQALVDIRSGPDTVELLEEGTVHLVWRGLYRHPALRRAPWPRLLALPHPLVMLVAPPDVRHARIIGKRHKGRVNAALASGPTTNAWKRGEQLWGEILDALPPGRLVRRVDSTGPEEETLRLVVEAIRELQAGAPQRQQAHAHR